MDDQELVNKLAVVLVDNRKDNHTMPAPKLYPHQWLWDSCFISIGTRHFDIAFAQTELRSLLAGQWSNGMVPNMIFDRARVYRSDRDMWRSWLSPFAPPHTATSGITQPPMIAEAVYRVNEFLPKREQKQWLKEMVPKIIAYHTWLYEERDPHNEGLTLQIHPYETGLDNTPPWITQLREHSKPWWIKAIELLKLDQLVNLVRRDTRHVPPGQRMKNIDALLYWDVVRRLRRKNYDITRILHRSLFCIEDITFNSVLVRANTLLEEMATQARIKLPEELRLRMQRTSRALLQCWDEKDKLFYSRDFITHDLINLPTIGSLLPLYAGIIPKEQAEILVKELANFATFKANFPVPSVPLNNSFFDHEMYWQGPSWVNTNWLLIDGLKRYRFYEEAENLRKLTVDLIRQNGAYEYFSPIEGKGLGAKNFSWTAALGIDLIYQNHQSKKTE